MAEENKIPAGEAVQLQGLIKYAPGAIVSRSLVESDSGTLTLFAFDAGQSLSEHSAPFDAVVQILSGSAEIRVGGKDIHTQAGQMVIMPADIPHAIRAEEQFKMLLIMMRHQQKEDSHE